MAEILRSAQSVVSEWSYTAGQAAKTLQGVRTSVAVGMPRGVLAGAKSFAEHALRGLGWPPCTIQIDRDAAAVMVEAVEEERKDRRKRRLSLREQRRFVRSLITVLEHIERGDGRFFGRKQRAYVRRLGRVFWEAYLHGCVPPNS